jgi:hopanoid biosynthesis associated RND transporter like protein HpnN
MYSPFSSVFARALRVLARVLLRHPRWFVWPQIFLCIFCILYTAGAFNSFGLHGLEMDMNRDNLVGEREKYHKIYLEFRKEFPQQDEIVVIAESESMERNRQFIERLAAKVEPHTNVFEDVFYKGDLNMLGKKALLFLDETNLVDLRNTLHDMSPFIHEFTQATNLNSLFELINKQIRTAKRETNAQNDALMKSFPALKRIIDEANASLSRPGMAVSPGVNALFGAGDEAEKQIYITFNNGQMYLLMARAKTDELNGPGVELMRQLVHETQLEVPGINVGITGGPVLEYDEMRQSEHDSTVASIASLIICSLIFIYAYQQTGRPLKAVLCLIIGLGYTMGFTTAVVGHLNILTITFAPMLIGLAIDFGVHYITRYEEEMRRGRSEAEGLEKAIVFTGQGIVTGAFTTAAAFLAMGFTKFKGIQEMGLISGGGLILCLVPMMTMLPALLIRGRQNAIDHQLGPQVQKRVQIENLWLERPLVVTGITLVICGLCATVFSKVFFDYNLLNMQSKGLPSVVYEQKLIDSAGQSVLYGAVVADNLKEAQEFEKRIKAQAAKPGSIISTNLYSATDFLAGDQSQKIRIVREITNELATVKFAPIDRNGVDRQELGLTLFSLNGYLDNIIAEVGNEDTNLVKQLQGLHDSITIFRRNMLANAAEIPERLYQFQEALFTDLHETFSNLREQQATPLRVEDLPPALRNRFIGAHGKLMIQVFPKPEKSLWQHENQKKILDELQSVIGDDNKVTGTPVQLYVYTTLLKESYQKAALYSLIAIAIMVFLHFHSPLCVILALLPVGIGTMWMLGFMGITGIPFNPANIMILPLVVGIGVTNGIHILNRFAEEQKPGILAKSTGKAVLVSGLTAITGFGSLILARHQGIQSLGFVMSVGIATCMIAGLTFLPALLTLLVRRGWMIGKKPSTLNGQKKTQ